MSRRLVTMSVGAVLLVVLGVVGVRIPVPYAALGPGPTVNTLGAVDGHTVIAVTDRNGAKKEANTRGHLQLTTVGVRDHLDLLTALRGWLDGSVAVVPREEIYPPNKTQKQVDQENTEEFVESQDAAQAAALGELNYPQQIVVKKLADDSPSHGRLEPQDVLTSLNGVKVTRPDDLTRALSALAPGTTVTVGYVRKGDAATTTITTTKAQDRAGAALGVFISAERVSPYTISFSLGNIGGPSAGLMFALGIIEKIGGTDLTGGRFIAGTGTIDADGRVGPIGGITQKMLGAKRDGATVFLVPKDNCAEARATAPPGLRLIRVENLHGAVRALQELKEGGTPAGC